ncbi:MAG: 3'(2'),5'-bisphosphate nucleotidase CysQ [Hyphomonadaceae bacterium]
MLGRLVDIALEAGKAVMAVYASEACEARAKDDGSPVTLADGAAEAVILRGLTALAPETAVVAEEEAAAGRTPCAASRFFLVDPLDGTKEFLSRNGDFTINIALVEAGEPVLGVVYAPAHGLMYAGERGAGARMAETCDGKPSAWRTITARAPCEAGLSVVASRSHMSDETRAFVERFTVADMVSAGSSLKFCRIAAGEADLYPRLGRTMEWDTAAGDAVLRAAGGRVRTMGGQDLRYGKRNQAADVDYANPWFVAAGRFDPFQA